MASKSEEERKKVVKGFKLPGRHWWSSSGKSVHDDPSLTPDDPIPPSLNPKTELRRTSTPEMRRLSQIAALKAMKPISYFDNLGSVDAARTGMAVKSRDALMSDIRSGKIKVPGGPGHVYVPRDATLPIGAMFDPSSETIDVGAWAREARKDRQLVTRGLPKDKDGNYRPASVIVGGKTFEDTDESLRAAGVVARNNEIARKTYDVLKSTGVYSPETLTWAGKGRFVQNGVASEMTEAGRQELYKEGFDGLRARYRSLSGQAGMYQQKLMEAQKKFSESGGFRGFDDFVTKKKDEYGLGYEKEYDGYEKNVQQKIAAAERAHNPSEAARLRQVLEGRRVQMQEMAQKKAMSMWAGSGAANLWRAQKELENTLANQQASAIRGMNAAMQSNAVLARQLGVPVQSLLDGKAPIADKSFGTQVAEWEAQEQGATSVMPNGEPAPPPAPEGTPPASEEQPGTSGTDSQTANVGRKKNPWEVV